MTSTNVTGVVQVQNLVTKVSKLSDDIGTGVDFTKMLQGDFTGKSQGYTPDASSDAVTMSVPTFSATSTSYEREQQKILPSKDQLSNDRTGSVENGADSEKLSQDAKEIDSEVKKAISDALDVSDEDVEKAMEELGLSVVDLLNPASLAELVSKLTKAEDSVGLLMSSTFTELGSQIADIFKSFALDNNMQQDEFTQVISSILDTEADLENTVLDLNEAGPSMEASDAFADTAKTSESAVITSHVTTIESDGQTTVTDVASDGDETTVVTQLAKPEESGKSTSQSDDDAQGKKDDDLAGNEHHAFVEAHVDAQRTFDIPAAMDNYVPQASLNPQEIIDQIVEQTRVSYSAAQDTSIEMILNPEELGKLLLKVTSDKSGQMTAQITVQNEDVKEALVQQMAMLKESLGGQGLKIDAIEVTVSSHAFEENLEEGFENEENAGEQAERQANQRRNINLNDLDSLQGLMTEEEQLAAAIMADQGNTMDVTA